MSVQATKNNIKSLFILINAKYYVSLDGVNIGIHTRTRNPAELFDARKMEIEQMYAFTQAVKEKFNIQ